MSDSANKGTVEKVVNGGKRLLRTSSGVVFLDQGLPGEEVTYEITQRQKGTQYGRVRDIASSSPHRQPADCALFPKCGGCNLIDATEEHRRQIKTAMLHDVLKRVGKWTDEQLEKVNELRGEAQPLGRIRATFHVASSGELGFFAPESHQIVPLKQCPALHPHLQNWLQRLKQINWGPFEQPWRLQVACTPDGRVGAALHELEPNVQKEVAEQLVAETGCAGVHLIHAQGHTLEVLGEERLHGVVAGDHPEGPFEHDPAAFTQSSFWGGQVLLEEARGFLSRMEGPFETCIELFSGAGHFSFDLLDRFEDLLCIEGDPRAFFWLAENRGKHPKQDAMEIWQAQVDGSRLDLLPDITGIDLLFMDPPRQGVKQLDRIVEALRPRHVLAVSCDMASGVRDLNLLQKNGYVLQCLQPLDIFARNHHLEWIAWLSQA